MPSVFTRIQAGEIPGTFVFRDALWFAILDINPAAPGHTLLVPVHEAQHLADLPPSTLAALGDRLARLIACIKAVTGAPAVNVAINDGPAAGQVVPHVHLHVIPRWDGDGVHLSLPPAPAAKARLAELAQRLPAAWR